MRPFGEGGHGGGLLYYFYILDEWAILPSLIFLGVGAMTDFGPLIANPKSFLLGAAAQFGIFAAYFGALLINQTGLVDFNDKAAAAISIIGGADGPTSIFLAGKLGQTRLLGPIAVAAYSYMSLVPIIQPPIMKLFTTEKERKIKMEQLRPVSKLEKILFPIVVTIVVSLILPTTAPLVGMLMLGNLFRESGVVRQLQETASNALMYIVVIILGTPSSIAAAASVRGAPRRFAAVLEEGTRRVSSSPPGRPPRARAEAPQSPRARGGAGRFGGDLLAGFRPEDLRDYGEGIGLAFIIVGGIGAFLVRVEPAPDGFDAQLVHHVLVVLLRRERNRLLRKGGRAEQAARKQKDDLFHIH